MIVRAMGRSDISACAKIMAETPLFQHYGTTLEKAALRFTAGLESGAAILVASESDQVLGFVWIVLNGAFDRSGYIPLFAVDPVHRGGGVGRRLLAAAESFLKSQGRDVFLLCSDFNRDAQRFYVREGFSKVGEIPDYVRPGVSEYIYFKRLMGGELMVHSS